MNRDRNFSLPLLLRNILRQNGEVCPQTWELVNPDSKVSAEENKLGGLTRCPSSIAEQLGFKGISGGLRSICPAPDKANVKVRVYLGPFGVMFESLQGQKLPTSLDVSGLPSPVFNHPCENNSPINLAFLLLELVAVTS